jgi:AcrR family transcriptional regulator
MNNSSLPASPEEATSHVKRLPSSDLGHRLLGATVKAFAENGILGARIAEITRAAGTTDPAFYRYFPSIRDAALFIMSEYYWKPLNRKLGHFSEVTSQPEAVFEAVITALIRSAEDNPDQPWISESEVFRIVVSQLRNPFLLPDSLRDPEYQAFMGSFEEILTRGQEMGLFDNRIQPWVMARTLVVSLHGLLADGMTDCTARPISEGEIRDLAHRIVGLNRISQDVGYIQKKETPNRQSRQVRQPSRLDDW